MSNQSVISRAGLTYRNGTEEEPVSDSTGQSLRRKLDMNSQKAYVAENLPPGDSLLMIALPDEHNELTLNLPVTESEDEDVLAMELERVS